MALDYLSNVLLLFYSNFYKISVLFCPDPKPELWSSNILLSSSLLVSSTRPLSSWPSLSCCSSQSERNLCCIGGNDNRPEQTSTRFGPSGIDLTSSKESKSVSLWASLRAFGGTTRKGDNSEWRSGEFCEVSETRGLFSFSSVSPIVWSGVELGLK